MEHTEEEPKDPYGDEVAKHPTKKPNNGSTTVTKKKKFCGRRSIISEKRST